MPGFQMASLVSMPAGGPSGLCCFSQGSEISSCSFSMPASYPSRAIASVSFRGGSTFSSKQSLFWSGCASHCDLVLLLLPDSQMLREVPARSFPSRIVGSRKLSTAADLTSASDARVVQKGRKAGWNGQKALIVTEGVCIVVAGASYSMSLLNRQQTTPVFSSSSAKESTFLPRFEDPSTWCVPALWVALVINAILRTWQRRPSTTWQERNIKDFTLDQRVGKLGEDVGEMTTTARMLSRHLEKLGVRFRATKRNLRDPVQETIELVKRTSAIVKELANREDILERELRNTQQNLIAIQEQQMKQLELLKAGVAKNSNSQREADGKIKKALHEQSIQQPKGAAGQARPPKSSNGEAGAKRPKLSLMNEIKNLWRSKVSNESSPSSNESSKEKTELANSNRATSSKGKPPFDVQSDHSVVAGAAVESETPRYYPDTRFRDEDYWATPLPSPSSESSTNGSSTEEVRDATDARSVENPDKRINSNSEATLGKLDSFFSSRKGPNSGEDDALPISQSLDALNVRQSSSPSGERNTNGNTPH